jgi:arylsulfatase A-like enzyme
VKVVLTVLDALPVRHVGPSHTPNLAALAAVGGRAPQGATAVMTSATYPNHATFVTGAGPDRHGILTNWVPSTGRVTPAWERGCDVATLFDACRAAGRSSAAVYGDQHLVGVTGATGADHHWPPHGAVPAGLTCDEMGYLRDADTATALAAVLDTAPDLVVSQLNGPDTAAHVHGPDSEAALAGYLATDTWLDVLRAQVAWDDTVWILVSDHDQEAVGASPAVDLQGALDARGDGLFALPEGNAALVCGAGAVTAADALAGFDGVAGAQPFVLADETMECCLVWAGPGRVFGFPGVPTRRGTHGGPRSRAQVAIVTGGHPAVEPLAGALEQRTVHAADWAPTVATLLGLDLPDATGRSLL